MTNFRHSSNTMKVTITELQNGDFVWNQGFLFKVTELRIEKNDNNRDVMRYRGIVVPGVDGNEHIIKTGYNGGTYGHNDLCECLIVKRDLIYQF